MFSDIKNFFFRKKDRIFLVAIVLGGIFVEKRRKAAWRKVLECGKICG
jgi:hypothetical protein